MLCGGTSLMTRRHVTDWQGIVQRCAEFACVDFTIILSHFHTCRPGLTRDFKILAGSTNSQRASQMLGGPAFMVHGQTLGLQPWIGKKIKGGRYEGPLRPSETTQDVCLLSIDLLDGVSGTLAGYWVGRITVPLLKTCLTLHVAVVGYSGSCGYALSYQGRNSSAEPW